MKRRFTSNEIKRLTEVAVLAYSTATSYQKSKLENYILKLNSGFIYGIMISTHPFLSNTNPEAWDDLHQHCCVGFLKGLRRYDIESDCSLLSYAAFYVRAAINEFGNSYALVRHQKNTKGRSIGYNQSNLSVLTTDEGSIDLLDSVLIKSAKEKDYNLDTAIDFHYGVLYNSEFLAYMEERYSSCGTYINFVKEVVSRVNDNLEDKVVMSHVAESLGISKERVRQLKDRLKGDLIKWGFDGVSSYTSSNKKRVRTKSMQVSLERAQSEELPIAV